MKRKALLSECQGEEWWNNNGVAGKFQFIPRLEVSCSPSQLLTVLSNSGPRLSSRLFTMATERQLPRGDSFPLPFPPAPLQQPTLAAEYDWLPRLLRTLWLVGPRQFCFVLFFYHTSFSGGLFTHFLVILQHSLLWLLSPCFSQLWKVLYLL